MKYSWINSTLTVTRGRFKSRLQTNRHERRDQTRFAEDIDIADKRHRYAARLRDLEAFYVQIGFVIDCDRDAVTYFDTK